MPAGREDELRVIVEELRLLELPGLVDLLFFQHEDDPLGYGIILGFEDRESYSRAAGSVEFSSWTSDLKSILTSELDSRYGDFMMDKP